MVSAHAKNLAAVISLGAKPGECRGATASAIQHCERLDYSIGSFFRRREYVALPQPHNMPSACAERRVHFFVALHVAAYLLRPEVCICWEHLLERDTTATVFVSVPGVTVNKYRQTSFGKDNIWLARYACRV